VCHFSHRLIAIKHACAVFVQIHRFGALVEHIKPGILELMPNRSAICVWAVDVQTTIEGLIRMGLQADPNSQ
jgi:hypothetical protein